MSFSRCVMFMTRQPLAYLQTKQLYINSIAVFSNAKRLASHSRCNKDVCLEHIYIEHQLKNSSDVVYECAFCVNGP